ncbi:MAG: response regulator transcription factor [Lachnospiraceae bacterium]|nr:response regulator transcription factor [Lachnospiraceae bacterium]
MKILLIEDDQQLCEALKFQLQKEDHSVDVCHDGRDGLDLFLQDAYDIVLLDRMLPAMNGLTVLKKAREQHIFTPVIILTALSELNDRIEGLDCGADDYIIKPFAFEELSARIRSIGRRNGSYEEHACFRFGDITLSGSLKELSTSKCSIPLSTRECRLMEVFIQNPNTVLRRMVILSRVWGADAPVEESNLDTYIHFLRKRLEQVQSRLQIKTVRGVGYKMEDPDVS